MEIKCFKIPSQTRPLMGGGKNKVKKYTIAFLK